MAINVRTHLDKALRKGLRFFNLILAILLVIYIVSGFYTVSPNEIGVHLRFGAIVSPRVPPGMHYRLPWPIDTVHRIPAHQVQRIHINDFGTSGFSPSSIESLEGWRGSAFRQPRILRMGYALSGDNNLVNLDCIVQYRVGDPERYLFHFRDKQVERLLYDATCSTIIHSVAGRPVDMILTTGKRAIEMEVQENLQSIVDAVETGVTITFVEMREVKAPAKVQKYFNDVINSKIDIQKAINHAKSYSNEEILASRERADRLIQDSEAYKNKVVSEALGDTGWFTNMHDEYRHATGITRRRLLIDTMKQILVSIDKAYVVADHGEHSPKLKVFKN